MRIFVATTALHSKADIGSRMAYVCDGPIVLKKSFSGRRQIFLGPPIHLLHRDVWDLIILQKTMTDFSIDFERPCSVGGIKKSAFAIFFGLFDFRLFQHNRPKCEVPAASGDVRVRE